jgi:hypothetical protein
MAISGTYATALTFEDFPMYLRHAVKGGVLGVDDTNTVHGYTYAYQPTPALDDLDTATMQFGHVGNPWLATGVMFNTFTISGDIDDSEAAWKWSSDLFAMTKDPIVDQVASGTAITSATATVLTKTGAAWVVNAFTGNYVRIVGGTGAGQVRLILSNTATTITVSAAFSPVPDATSLIHVPGAFTTGIADRTRNSIDAPGTQLFIDNPGGTIGTTPVLGRFISFSVTGTNNITPKRFLENMTGYSSKVGRGARQYTGSIRFEFDNRDEYDKWVANTSRLVRIQKVGPVINVSPATNYLARIDLPAAYWDAVTEDERDSNITATFAFKGYLDAAAGYPALFTAKNRLATLP